MARRAKIAVGVALSLILFGPLAWTPARAADPANPPMDPKTGEPPGAPVGCCCLPKLQAGAFECVAKTTEFDCKAQCAELKDGRLPSGCKWTVGACPP